MVNLGLREIIEDPANPKTQAQPQRQRVPPTLDTALGMEDKPSTTVDLYTEERKVQNAKLSPYYKVIVLRLRPTNQKTPVNDTVEILYSERLDGFDSATLRDRLIQTLRKLEYKEETPLAGGWEYTFSYMNRRGIETELKKQIEKIR